MDKDNNKLKDYFDQFLEDESTPAFVWDDIDQKLDLEEAGLLEDSFDQFYEDEAPDAILAENIHDHLEQQNSDALKTNFDAFYADEEVLPPVWSNVQDQLDLDQTWTKMEPGLDSAQKWHQWKIRLKRITAAAMLLLLLRTCVGDGNYASFINTNDKQNTEPIALKNQQPVAQKQAKLQETSLPILKQNNRLSEKEISKKKQSNTNESFASKKSVSSDERANKKARNTIVSNRNNSTKAKPSEAISSLGTVQLEAPVSSVLSHSSNKKNNDPQTDSDNKNIAISGGSNTEQPTINNVSKNTNLTHTTTTGNQQLGNTITISTSKADSPLLASSEEATKDLSTLDLKALFAHTFALDSFEFPLAETLPFELEKKRNNPLLKFPKFELGLIGKIGTSFLLNNLTSESLRYNSLNDTKLHASGSVGLIGSLRFDSKNALVFQAAPYTPVRQSYTAFSSSGTYYEQDIKLTYLDFSLGYERTLFTMNKHNGQPLSSIFARADVGISYLSVEEISQNDALVEENAFNKLNYSLTLALGNKHHIKRFTIDYGIFGTVGLNDINNYTFLGNQATNLINLGGFLGLRYQL